MWPFIWKGDWWSQLFVWNWVTRWIRAAIYSKAEVSQGCVVIQGVIFHLVSSFIYCRQQLCVFFPDCFHYFKKLSLWISTTGDYKKNEDMSYISSQESNLLVHLIILYTFIQCILDESCGHTLINIFWQDCTDTWWKDVSSMCL